MYETQSYSPLESNARVLVVTGAGISAESGIPTFRGKDGYWRNLDPKQLATEEAFHSDPRLVWEWYRERRSLIRRSQPNAAHQAVVRLAANVGHFLLLTQNVDDLHTRAEWHGRRLSQEQVVQIHGDIFITRCSHCGFSRRDTDQDEMEAPKCPTCDGLMRPGVIWFDEELDPGEVQRVEGFLAEGSCEAVVVIGTTATFDYITNWVLAAKGETGRLIEINPAESALSKHATELIRRPVATVFPRIASQLIGHPEY